VCGIAGWFAPAGAPVDPEVLRRMTATLAHRGPDGEGMVTGAGFGLGHRRLSIVDLSGGAQPMQEPGGEITVCFNGEIYNHRSLRRDLEWYGHRFATQSDTEALVHGHRQWGERLPSRLNGMFAYAIWDARTRTGWLARDRFGEKPLYLAHLSDGSLLFASELRALLEHPRIERRMSVPAIATYLTLEYLPWPQSPIVGIEKLEPGTCLRWHDGEVVRSRFAEVGFEPDEDVRSDDEWVEQVREELAQSVKLRMMADVPLGVFLSGGVDSSSIAALMGEAVPPGEIHTFSIAFEDPSFDESGYARAVAEALGTTHHVRSFSEQTLLDLVPKLMAHMDEPFGDPSLLPTHLLALFTREHVKVALGGDGGDELFMGYETFRADTAARAFRRLPPWARRSAERLAESMPVRTSNFSLDFVAKSFVRGADSDDALRHTRWLASSVPHSADDPLRTELRETIPDTRIYGVMANPYLDCRDGDHLQRLSFAYIRSYLAEDILTKVDRATMAAGLEARAPFLDPALVRLAARMPARLKLRHGFSAKWALKRAVEDSLPGFVTRRKKKGFGVPIARWLNGPLRETADRLLDPVRIEAGGILDARVVSRLLSEHRAGTRDHRKPLWTLMMLEAWRERWRIST
jgi:asparagine synthase (glutamine-hydrolysing)